LKFFARLIIKWAWMISIVGTLLAMIGGYYTVQLYKNLRTDVEELLPTTARSIIDLNQVTGRLESVETLVVLVFSKDTVASKRFVNDLAERLNQVPKNVIASVEYRIDKEIEFFSKRRSLFIEVDDLKKIKTFIRDRIDYEKELYNPLNIFAERDLPEPVLDYFGLKKKYEGKTSGFAHLPGGYYALPDESVRLLVIYMPGKGLDTTLKMKQAIVKAVADTDPKKYAPDLEVKYTGNLQNMIEESAALVADLELSTVICLVLVLAVMLIFYRAFWATMLLLWALFMGTFWTFGAAFFAVGYLNANTAFLASIVIGNGINFGVMYLARYLEERRNGHKHEEATEIAICTTATSTWTAALAAGLAYGSLMLTGFRGFNQFGLIGLMGMILCWISSYVLLPAYFTTWDRVFGDRWVSLRPPKALFSRAIAHIVSRFPGTVSLVAIAGIVASLMVLPKFKNGVIETDMSKLRDKECMEKGAGALYHYIDDVFKHSVSPMVMLPQKREDARRLANYLREIDHKDGSNSIISNVQTMDDFIPKDQEEKIKVLKEIKALLPPKLLSRLPASEQGIVKELLAPEALRSFTEAELPPLIIGKFREKDGTFGKIVLLDKKFDGKTDDVARISRFVELGRHVADTIAIGTPVAGQLPVSYDLFKAIENDGPKATLFAFAAVISLIVILFRNFKTSAQVLSALMMGVLWLSGMILGFELKINFLNFIALPITFGIGVDYAVNVFNRYREVGSGQIVEVIEHTGGAVMLASLTTIIGYSSLLIAGNQAFVSFGIIAVLGELTCVTAAVVALPAMLRYLDMRKLRKAAAVSSDQTVAQMPAND